MVSERLEEILSQNVESYVHSRLDVHKDPLACTLWYSNKSGTIYGLGDGNPRKGKPYIQPIHLRCDIKGVLPELANKNDHVTHALSIVFDQIKYYRTKTFHETYAR